MPLPTDPLLAQQWHLNNATAGLLDLNVFGVWNPDQGPAYTGAGIWTVVIDDGFDYTHSDFTNYDQNLDFDFDLNTLDPFGAPSDAHGTAVAGIIGAAANGTGAVGVAFGTSMIGYRVAGFIGDAWLQDIRDAISNAATNANADVVNISQGISNDLASEFGVGYDALRFDEIEASITTAVNTGRGGLGLTIVKSAGNSRAGDYDVNADDWTNDTRQVVVAAVDQNGFVSSYSSYGAAILVSAFGTPGQVVTTDRVGADGSDATDFTSTFNGTSSAAPMVAGVVALMYDANAGLGWRDVQSILANSARHVGSAVGAGIAGSEEYAWGWNQADTWNGGGLHFSNDYGYGLVDALAAVRMAETWLLGGASAQKTSSQFSNSMVVRSAPIIIPDGNATGLTFSGTAAFDDLVERVTVEMTFSTTFTGDLEVYLTSPDGTVSQLIADTGGSNDFNGTWTFESQAFRGERAAGTWSVRVVDDAGADVLTVTNIVIRTFGDFSADDRYVFTNEYSDYAGIGGHVTALNDTNFGTDVVNASAVTLASVIRLDGLGSTIDGVNLTINNVENAIGGDGADVIFGNSGVNLLYGMRGNDLLNGLGGQDYMFGNFGDDSYYVDVSGDSVTESIGQGIDRVYASISYALAAGQEIEVLKTTNAAAGALINLTGNEFVNNIQGNAGANVLNGGAGNDVLYGFGGDDSYYVDSSGDTILEGIGGGLDRVYASSNYALAGGQEIEFLKTTNAAGSGNLNLTGNEFGNNIQGNVGDNVINGKAGVDLMFGFGGNDSFYVDLAGDSVFEVVGGGSDRVYASVSYALAVGQEIEILKTTNAAGIGSINLSGNEFVNNIQGNNGSNFINGGLGNDLLYGFGGSDSFVFSTALGATNRDSILDYNVAADTVRLMSSIFGILPLGALAANLFKDLSLGAQDANDVIIYNRATGDIFYDINGLAAGGQTLFADVTNGLVLTNADFFVA